MYQSLNPWDEDKDKYHTDKGSLTLDYARGGDEGGSSLYHSGNSDEFDPKESYHKMENDDEKDNDKKDEKWISEEEGSKGDYESGNDAPPEKEDAKKDLSLSQISSTLNSGVNEERLRTSSKKEAEKKALKDVESLIESLSLQTKKREVINLDKQHL